MIRCALPRGVTLIELLIVLFILGLVASILAAALVRGREAARLTQCKANLHQLGVALAQHHEARGGFPIGAGTRSYLWKLLPYLGEAPRARTVINDQTAAVPIPGLFLCPSDSARDAPLSRFATNYAGNAGSFGRGDGSQWDGAFQDREVSAQEVPDGLGFTIGVAEWIVGSGKVDRPSRLGSIHFLDGDFLNEQRGGDAFAEACAELSVDRLSPTAAPFKGSYWFRGRLGHSLYTHALSPNQPSCRAAPDLNAITAGSLHGSGSNVVMLDGSVRFISQSIESSVWRALGTRGGGETISTASY